MSVTMPMMWRSLLLCLSIVAADALGQQIRDGQRTASAPDGTASIVGQVRSDDEAGRPVRRAAIHLQARDADGWAGTPERIAITDDAGAFVFDKLPAGHYAIWATKPAYVSVWYGSKRPGDPTGMTSVVLADGQAITSVSLKMPKGAAITGTVFDQTGQPAAGVTVSVLQSRIDFQTGQRSFVAVGAADSGVADSRGVYRIYGLTAGSYVVKADTPPALRQTFRQPSGAEWQWADAPNWVGSGAGSMQAPPERSRSLTYAPVFHPGTPVQANARIVTVRSAEERTGVDIRLELVPTATVSGTVQVLDGVRPEDVLVVLIRRRDEESRPIASLRPGADGVFTFPNLPPGAYSVAALRMLPRGAKPSWALAEVDVDGADRFVGLVLQPALPVSARVSFAGASPAPADLTRVRVDLKPMPPGAAAAMGPVQASAAANGRVVFSSVLPGRYQLTASVAGSTPGGGWILSAATVDDRDVLDLPIEIQAGGQVEVHLTFTDRAAEIMGTLVDGSGRPALDYLVIAFPADPRYWLPGSRRIRAMRPVLDGGYRFANLPAGDYLIAAVTDVEQYQWFDPTFLGQLKGYAVPLTLRDGDRKTQDLRIGGR